MCDGDHDRFLPGKLRVELMTDKMVTIIARNDNRLPGFPVICAVSDTDTAAINPKDEKSMARTTRSARRRVPENSRREKLGHLYYGLLSEL